MNTQKPKPGNIDSTGNVAGPRASKAPEGHDFVKEVMSNASGAPQELAPGTPVVVALGNRETMINELIECAVRLAHEDINFRFEAASGVGEFIKLATRPETRLALFIPPGNLEADPGSPAVTPEEEAVRIIAAIKTRHPIPIIVMAVQIDARERLLAAGADIFLELTAPLEQIIDAFNKCLGRERPARRSGRGSAYWHPLE